MEKAQKTYSPKKQDIVRQWFHIDGNGQVLGKVATRIADLLRGKRKPIWAPHVDCGDFVIVTNADKIVLTGNKETQKQYYSHSGYMGHVSSTTPDELRRKGKADWILMEAVKGMIPRNKLRDDVLSKLKIFPGEAHNHEAQKPVTIEI
jgi:large subunit ribosomal protein L13